MRAIALATIAWGVILAGAAGAETWTDPDGRVTFDKPRGWQVDPQNSNTGTVVLAFDGSHDCFIVASPNAATSTATPRQVVRSTTTPFAQSAWESTASGISTLFPNGASMTSQSVDTSGDWPVQRAEFQGADGPVFGMIQGRPGMDLMAFCAAYGSDSSVFNGVFGSIGHPNDAQWEQQLATENAAAEAAAAAQQSEPAPAQ